MQRGPKKRWTKEYIVKVILDRREKSLSLHTRGVLNELPSLFVCARREFGTWRAAIEAAGLVYDTIRRTPAGLPVMRDTNTSTQKGASKTKKKGRRYTWTKNTIIARIQKRARDGEALNVTGVQREWPALYSIARREFGTWRKAIEAANLRYETIIRTRRWSKATIRDQIRSLAENGFSIRASTAITFHRPLFEAAIRYFGGWAKAVEDAGYVYEDVSAHENWSKPKILECIRDRVANSQPISIGDLQDTFGALYTSGCNYFGSWEKAVEAAGYNYREVCQQFRAKDFSRSSNEMGDRVELLRSLGSRKKSLKKKHGQ